MSCGLELEPDVAFRESQNKTTERKNMGKTQITIGGLAVMVALGLATPSSATMVQYGLFDTGVDGSGNSLAGGITDTHWTLNSGPAVVVNSGFPIPPWVDYSSGNGASRWISVDSGGGNANLPISDQIFSTTFTLTGLTGVTLSGSWASDNASELILNGHSIGSIPFGTPGNYSFQQYTSFSESIQADFNLNGLNTLEILDHNGDATQPNGNPGGWFGVRANDLTITGTPVPEPTTMVAGAMLLLPFAFSTLRILRRRTA
jgi:hypothetical protein